MRSLFKVCVVSLVFLGLVAHLPANGINLNGVGAKAVSMGGAFVGLANDYSAVFWNPAGLTQMKAPSLTVYGAGLMPSGKYSLPLFGISAETESKVYLSGALAYYQPLSEKLVVGLAAYVPSGLGATYKGADLQNFLQPPTALEWESYLGVITVSPVIAYKISDQFSIGATINFNYGLLNLKRPGLGQYSEELSGTGFGATIGAMFKPMEGLSFGATLKLPTKIKLSGDAEMPGAALLGLATSSDAEREATWPLWLGFGVAWNPIEKLTICADIQYTNWAKFETIPITYDTSWETAKQIPVYGAGFQNDFTLNWEDAVQIRFGLQYQASESLALRAGYYSDPTVAPDNTLNILLPQHTYQVVTFGVGYNSGSIQFDLCVEYLMGKERVAPLTGPMPGTYNMDILVPSIAVTINL